MLSFLPLGQQLALVAGVLIAGLGGPLLAASLLMWRKRRVRAAKRTPLTTHLLRGPGHALRLQLEDLRLNALSDLTLLGLIPLLLVCVHLGQSYLLGSPEGTFRTLVLSVGSIGFIGVGCYRLLKKFREADAMRLGLDAEIAVGQELDQLMRQGAAVFHDFPGEHFNIDHVVISKQGVFTVETKGYAKPNRSQGTSDAKVEFDGRQLKFPTWSTATPLDQAKRQALWLGKWLSSAVGSPMVATPVLALPGWYVERKGRGDVRVFSGKELPKLLARPGLQALSEQDVQRVAHQIEQRCRDVQPFFRKDEGG